MSLYLWLNIFTFCTLFLSFDKKVAFYKYFPYLAIGIILNGLLFIPWDIVFTQKGVWGFNPDYLSGKSLFNLPLEECLFFITVPFSCTFIHFVLIAYFKNPVSQKFSNIFWNSVSAIVLILGLIYYDQKYTFVTFTVVAPIIFFLNKVQPAFMKQFVFTYAVSFIPFLIINSILTGSFTDEPIVWYNNEENFGIRLGTIPVEDTVYNLLLLVIPTFITSYLFSKKRTKA
jgi:lycopene cyclase domain-containing protein